MRHAFVLRVKSMNPLPSDDLDEAWLGNNEWDVDRTPQASRPVDKDAITERVDKVPASRLLLKDVTAWGMKVRPPIRGIILRICEPHPLIIMIITKTALAEEHLSLGAHRGDRRAHALAHLSRLLGNFEEGDRLAAEAMGIADHVSQPDSVYHGEAGSTRALGLDMAYMGDPGGSD